MKRRVIVFLSAVCAAALSGCYTPRTSGVMVEKGRLFIEDPAFAVNIDLVRDACETTNEGFLHAQVTLKNTNREDYRCQYRFEWRDKNGMMQSHQPTPWRPLVLHGREIKDLDAVSLLQNTADFRLTLRRED